MFGLWVTSAARNTGVAWRLVEAACDEALQSGWGHLYYWVGSQNGRAIGFASKFGFWPTSHRRTARTPGPDGHEHQEIAMVLSLPSNAGCAEPDGTAADRPAWPGREWCVVTRPANEALR